MDQYQRMQQLADIPILLTECFYPSQWLDILEKYPTIISIFKNDEVIKNQNHFLINNVDWDNPSDVATELALEGGHCGYGPKDFNYENIKKFLTVSQAIPKFNKPLSNSFTKETLEKILPMIKKFFDNNTNGYDYYLKKQYIANGKDEKWLELMKKNKGKY